MEDPPDTQPPFPDLHQSEVDEATLRQLFDDVAHHAELIEIIPKHGPGYVEENPGQLPLGDALELILARSLRGLQLRYRYQDKTWWDTLMPLPGGLFRIVRIEHDFA